MEVDACAADLIPIRFSTLQIYHIQLRVFSGWIKVLEWELLPILEPKMYRLSIRWLNFRARMKTDLWNVHRLCTDFALRRQFSSTNYKHY